MSHVHAPARENETKNRWQNYLDGLFVLGVITIVAPLVVFGVIVFVSSQPGQWPVGYIGVALSPVLFAVLAIGLMVAFLSVVTVPIYIVRYKIRGHRAFWQWLLVVLAAAYLITGLYLSIGAYLTHRAFDRVFTREEAASFIRSCQVGELLRRPDDSTQVIARGNSTAAEFKSNISHVSVGSYEDLKQVAQASTGTCGPIKTRD